MNTILKNIEDDKIYSYVKKTYKKIEKTKNLLSKQKEFVCEADLILLTRIEERYLPSIIEKYVVLSKKEKKKQRERLLDSLSKIKEKIIEIKEQTEERAVHELTKHENLMELMIERN